DISLYQMICTVEIGCRPRYGLPMERNMERWRQLCEQAAVERDSGKLLELIREINRLLNEKKQRLAVEKNEHAESPRNKAGPPRRLRRERMHSISWCSPSGLVTTASTPKSSGPLLMLYMVNKTMGTLGMALLRTLAASSPLIFGMPKSSTIRSGLM